VSRTRAVSTSGFSSASHSSAALCLGQQLFPLAVLAALLTAALLFVAENSLFHVWRCRSLLSFPSPSVSRTYVRERGSSYESFLHIRMCKIKKNIQQISGTISPIYKELFFFISEENDMLSLMAESCSISLTINS